MLVVYNIPLSSSTPSSSTAITTASTATDSSSVSTPAFGVTTTNLTPSTPAPTSSTTQTTTPANAGFSSNTVLQTPTSIVAPAISSISTASSITAPNSSPITGLPGNASSVTPPNAGVPSSSTPTSSGVTPPNGSSPGTASGVTPPSGGNGTVVPQAVIVTGPNGKVKDCYKDATSLAARAELNEKDAKDMMDAQEQCSRNEAEEKIAGAYMETGGIYKDPKVAHDQAKKDMQAIDDYAKAKGLSQGDRIELNMNIAVGLATRELSLKEFQGMRDNAKQYTEGTKACNAPFSRFTKKCEDFQRKEFFNPGAFDLLNTSRNELSPKNREKVASARAKSEKNIARAKCKSQYAGMEGGGGFSLGASFGVGGGYGNGLSSTNEVGVAQVRNGSIVTTFGYQTTGGYWNGGSQYDAPKGSEKAQGIFGASISVGGNAFGTNARTPDEYKGSFDTGSIAGGTGIEVGVTGSTGSGENNRQVNVGGISLGEGFGISGNFYPTSTEIVWSLTIDLC